MWSAEGISVWRIWPRPGSPRALTRRSPVPRGMGGLGQEGGGLAEVVIGFEAGALRDQLVEDAPAEVELPGLGVVALLGVEGQG